jgi:hypothetical protein
MRRFLTILLAAGALSALGAPVASAAQPGLTCPSPATVPGFNQSAFLNTATQVYAANSGGANSTHAGNQHTVSQYDVACFQGP